MVNGVSEMVFRRLEKLLLHAGIGPDEVIVADMWCGQRPGDVNGGPSKWLNEKPMRNQCWSAPGRDDGSSNIISVCECVGPPQLTLYIYMYMF